MVAVTKIKIYKTDNRHYIYLPSNFIQDSAFPFDVRKNNLQVRLDGNKLVIEKVS